MDPLVVSLVAALAATTAYAWRQRNKAAGLQSRLAKLQRQTEVQLETDPLTQLPNRTALERWLAQPASEPGLLVVCDLDNFKALNDHYGHLVGDEVLRGAAQLIRASIRQEDRAFRWGGDEFVIFFRARNRDLVEKRLQALQHRLANFVIRGQGPVSLGLSWGVASLDPGASGLDCLRQADQQMLEAKRQRRLSLTGTQQDQACQST